jgi:hypothetical protein
MEAILVERMSGFPVLYVPSSLLGAANATVPTGQQPSPQQAQAQQTLTSYKKHRDRCSRQRADGPNPAGRSVRQRRRL